MLLVFLFALVLSILLALYIKIDIKHIDINNANKFKFDFLIEIDLYLLNKLKILKFTINKNSKVLKKIISNFNSEKFIKYNNLKLREAIKCLKLNFERFYFNLDIGSQFIFLTPILVTAISTFISITVPLLISKYDKKKFYYNITPVYCNKDTINLKFSGIVSFKLVHIIYMLIRLRSDKKYERTSNRRPYGYSYE